MNPGAIYVTVLGVLWIAMLVVIAPLFRKKYPTGRARLRVLR